MACHYGSPTPLPPPAVSTPHRVSLSPFGQLYEDVSLELCFPKASCLAASASREYWQNCSRIKATQKGISCTFFFATLFLADLSNPQQGVQRVPKPCFETKELNHWNHYGLSQALVSHYWSWSKTGGLTHQVEQIHEEPIERTLPCRIPLIHPL